MFEPVQLSFDAPIIDLSAGGHHSSFITKNLELFSCGQGSSGQLGIGECDLVFNLTQVMDNVIKVAAGEKHSMVLKSDHSVMSTGANDFF